MARRKSPVAEAVANAQQANELVTATAERMAMPPNAAVPEAPETSFDSAELDKPVARERSSRRGVLGFHFRDGASIEMIDRGGAVGVHFELPGGAKPSPELIEAVKSEYTHGQTVKSGLRYDAREKSWMKRVSDNPIGDRLEVEARTKLAAERYLESKNLDGASRG